VVLKPWLHETSYVLRGQCYDRPKKYALYIEIRALVISNTPRGGQITTRGLIYKNQNILIFLYTFIKKKKNCIDIRL
jgi:hypothetical protein